MREYPKASIVIPCFNEEETIKQSISQCVNQDYSGLIQIIVVDDGSTDETQGIVNQYLIPTVMAPKRTLQYHWKENGGKPSALNLGYSLAEGEYTVSTDGDTVLKPDAIRLIIEKFMESEEIGVVAGLVVIKNNQELLCKVQEVEYLFGQLQFRFLQSTTGDVLISPGAIYGVRTDLARRFPSTDRTIVEDFDQTVQIRKAGYDIVQEPRAVSYTVAPDSLGSWWNQRKRWWYGAYQVWRFNKNHLQRNPWFLYIHPFGSMILIANILLLAMHIINLGFFGRIFVLDHYIAFNLLLLGLTVLRNSVILNDLNRRDLVPYTLHYILYDFLCMVLQVYLLLRYITNKGITMRYGPEDVTVY